MVCPQQHDRAQLATFTWGVTGTDLNVQNDYDGDGKTDFAVWRNTDGKFYIFNPVTGNISVVSWGAPERLPCCQLRHALGVGQLVDIRKG